MKRFFLSTFLDSGDDIETRRCFLMTSDDWQIYISPTRQRSICAPRSLFQGWFGDVFAKLSVLKLWLTIFWQFFHYSQKTLSGNEFRAEIEFQIKLISNNFICILFCDFQQNFFQLRKLNFSMMQNAFIVKLHPFQQSMISQQNFKARHGLLKVSIWMNGRSWWLNNWNKPFGALLPLHGACQVLLHKCTQNFIVQVMSSPHRISQSPTSTANNPRNFSYPINFNHRPCLPNFELLVWMRSKRNFRLLNPSIRSSDAPIRKLIKFESRNKSSCS